MKSGLGRCCRRRSLLPDKPVGDTVDLLDTIPVCPDRCERRLLPESTCHSVSRWLQFQATSEYYSFLAPGQRLRRMCSVWAGKATNPAGPDERCDPARLG